MKSLSSYFIIIVLILGFLGIFFWQKSKKPKEISLPATLPKIMKISSSAFENNSPIPPKYTCDGQDINPPLEIKDIPEGTNSLVLIVDDPDAPKGTFLHWLVWNIPPETTLIEESHLPEGAVQGKNDFGKENYGGPCPPFGTHRYFFKVYALDKVLDLPEGSSLKEVEEVMKGHILDQAQLIGLYQRK
jgi:Raf kinase inhibitor-like YbhB/YbcL family protein